MTVSAGDGALDTPKDPIAAPPAPQASLVNIANILTMVRCAMVPLGLVGWVLGGEAGYGVVHMGY